MEEEKKTAIEGLNRERLILAEALTRVSHNQSIKISSRLNEIDEQIQQILTTNK